NGYNRYLTKSSTISRTATITKRKIENNNNLNENQFNTPLNSASINNDNTTVRYGTITKGTIHRPFQNSNNNHNRTFDLLESKLELIESPTTSSDDNEQIITSKFTTTTPARIDNHRPINANTITKTNRRILNVSLDVVGRNNHLNVEQCDDLSNTSPSETDNGSDLNHANNLMITSDELADEFGLSSDSGLTDNNDLIKRSSLKNRTFDMDMERSNNIEDCNDDDNSKIVNNYNQISDTSDRNYPTITRNTTMLLRREASQGQIINNRKFNNINNRTISRTPQTIKQVYLVSSNDDLLN
ncbi:hypothetical protein BLA29_007993, partial [Euroglyphus maynei]